MANQTQRLTLPPPSSEEREDGVSPKEAGSPPRRTLRRRLPVVAIAGAMLSLLAIGIGAVFFWAPSSPNDAQKREVVTITAQRHSLVVDLAVVGTVEPGQTVNVLAPFDGVIKEKMFEVGGTVDRGQPLLTMDTLDIGTKLRTARVAVLRAARVVEDLKSWGNSPDVARAKRGLVSAKQASESAKRRVTETKALLDRGIVARNEYEQAVEQLRSQDIALATARETLETELGKANPENVQIAELELENARARYAELDDMALRGAIATPVSGLVLRPPQGSREGTLKPAVDAGSRVSRNDVVATIASLEILTVKAAINEIDVNYIEPGQDVEITGDAFGAERLKGQVKSVSPQALESPGLSSRSSTFELLVRITSLTEPQRRVIRLGMTSNLLIRTYENPTAIVIPAEAIRRIGGEAVVDVVTGASGQSTARPIIPGHTTREGVEIISGLKQGDQIELRPKFSN